MLHHPLSDAIGKEAIMTDFHEAGGEHVHQEAAHELHRLSDISLVRFPSLESRQRKWTRPSCRLSSRPLETATR